MLNVRQAIKISLGSIMKRRTPSGLTTLVIIIGIAAVVANFSLRESFNTYFEGEIKSSGFQIYYRIKSRAKSLLQHRTATH